MVLNTPDLEVGDSTVNMNKIRRAFERGNKVVLFDVHYNLSKIWGSCHIVLGDGYEVYHTWAGFREGWKARLRAHQLRRTPIGTRVVVVPDLDRPDVLAANTSVVGLVELMAGYWTEELAVMTGHDGLFLKAVYAVYYGRR